MAERKSIVWISLASVVIALLGIIPAYNIFWNKPDVIYETDLVNIPLPSNLTGNLPNYLALVTVENIGHRPSTELQGDVTVDGQVLQYDVKGPDPAYAQVTSAPTPSGVKFSCPRLAPGEYPIKISVWYRGSGEDPTVGVADSLGPGNKVKSIPGERAKLKSMAVSIGSVLAATLAILAQLFLSWRRLTLPTEEREILDLAKSNVLAESKQRLEAFLERKAKEKTRLG